jgi:hypothetical protein
MQELHEGPYNVTIYRIWQKRNNVLVLLSNARHFTVSCLAMGRPCFLLQLNLYLMLRNIFLSCCKSTKDTQ